MTSRCHTPLDDPEFQKWHIIERTYQKPTDGHTVCPLRFWSIVEKIPTVKRFGKSVMKLTHKPSKSLDEIKKMIEIKKQARQKNFACWKLKIKTAPEADARQKATETKGLFLVPILVHAKSTEAGAADSLFLPAHWWHWLIRLNSLISPACTGV